MDDKLLRMAHLTSQPNSKRINQETAMFDLSVLVRIYSETIPISVANANIAKLYLNLFIVKVDHVIIRWVY